MNALLLTLLILGQLDSRTERIRKIQASELQRHEQSIKEWKQQMAGKDDAEANRLRRYISIAASKIKAIRRGGIPAVDLDVERLEVGGIGRLVAGGPEGHLWAVRLVKLLDDGSLVVLLTNKERTGGSLIPSGMSVPLEYSGRAIQMSVSGRRTEVEKGQLILKGWGTAGLKVGGYLDRELLNCLVEVQAKQNGLWVLEKLDADELRKVTRSELYSRR